MMNVARIEHILRAAGDATGQTDFVLVGSAAIFLWVTVVPDTMAMTREADIYAPVPDSAEAERIASELDAILGHSSPFDNEYGYYCDGVGPDTALLPTSWQDRAKNFSSPNTNGVSALVPHPIDLAISKLAAPREKDMEWLVAGVAAGIFSISELRRGIDALDADDDRLDIKFLNDRMLTLENRARGAIGP
jgi:hypothetical protein